MLASYIHRSTFWNTGIAITYVFHSSFSPLLLPLIFCFHRSYLVTEPFVFDSKRSDFIVGALHFRQLALALPLCVDAAELGPPEFRDEVNFHAGKHFYPRAMNVPPFFRPGSQRFFRKHPDQCSPIFVAEGRGVDLPPLFPFLLCSAARLHFRLLPGVTRSRSLHAAGSARGGAAAA